MLDYEWEHAKIVADRCAKRFKNRKDMERYLIYCGWDMGSIERMMKYIDRKRGNENE